LLVRSPGGEDLGGEGDAGAADGDAGPLTSRSGVLVRPKNEQAWLVGRRFHQRAGRVGLTLM
jgi:hypothetical protein